MVFRMKEYLNMSSYQVMMRLLLCTQGLEKRRVIVMLHSFFMEIQKLRLKAKLVIFATQPKVET